MTLDLEDVLDAISRDLTEVERAIVEDERVDERLVVDLRARASELRQAAAEFDK